MIYKYIYEIMIKMSHYSIRVKQVKSLMFLKSIQEKLNFIFLDLKKY